MPGIPLRTFVSLILGVRCTKWAGSPNGIQASEEKDEYFLWWRMGELADGLWLELRNRS
jgi:hypothetical protein